jgi:hypothetical protein
MITNEEARKELNGIGLENASGRYDYDNIQKSVELLDDYITQQEKVNKLLRLYVTYSRAYETMFIKLKENKEYNTTEHYAGLQKEINRLFTKINKIWSELNDNK